MISVVLYGRNDNYGYNLHKRAALSLNCIAEMLTAADDEILFVDYNTPDDYPTFPEAIRDVLTPRALGLIRVLRVRPRQHARFRDKSHLIALEPIARNVALRRSSANNRWVLSTNTDMIFVSRNTRSLSEIAADLPDGFYHLPRFEIPELVWETLDRLDPKGVIEQVGRWGWDLHLNEIVHGPEITLYDGPGDFQLALRTDLFAIQGFDERMLLGWHVDSNLAKRLGLLRGKSGTLVDQLFGYHCNHTRQVTAAHKHDRLENDWGRFIGFVDSPYLPEQFEEWGLSDETVETIGLNGEAVGHIQALRAALGDPMAATTDLRLVYDAVGYDASHVVPFVVDALASYPRTTTIGWIGAECELLRRFSMAWQAFEGTGRVLVPAAMPWLTAGKPAVCEPVDWDDLTDRADVFVIDFGPALLSGGDHVSAEAERITYAVAEGLHRSVIAEHAKADDNATARRFIVVNAVYSRFQPLLQAHVAAPFAPAATRLRQGFIMPPWPNKGDILSRLHNGTAGAREGTSVRILRGIEGWALFGGYLDLLPGSYCITIALDAAEMPESAAPPLRLDAVVENIAIETHEIGWDEIATGEIGFTFTVTDERPLFLGRSIVELHLHSNGALDALVRSVRIDAVSAPSSEIIDSGPSEPALPSDQAVSPVEWTEWLSRMYRGEAAAISRADSKVRRLWHSILGLDQGPMDTACGGGVAARPRKRGHVVFGPYCVLEPGRYELCVDLAAVGAQPRKPSALAGQVAIEVLGPGDVLLAHKPVSSTSLGAGAETVQFTIAEPDQDGTLPRIEFRVWTKGSARFVVRSVRTRRIACALPLEDVNSTVAESASGP